MKFDINHFLDEDKSIQIRNMWKMVPWETFVALCEYIEPPEEILGDLLNNAYIPDSEQKNFRKEREFIDNNNYNLEKLFEYKKHDLGFYLSMYFYVW